MKLKEAITRRTYGPRHGGPKKVKKGRYGEGHYAAVIYEYIVPDNILEGREFPQDLKILEKIDNELSSWAGGLSVDPGTLAFREPRRSRDSFGESVLSYAWIVRVPTTVSFDNFVEKMDEIIEDALRE